MTSSRDSRGQATTPDRRGLGQAATGMVNQLSRGPIRGHSAGFCRYWKLYNSCKTTFTTAHWVLAKYISGGTQVIIWSSNGLLLFGAKILHWLILMYFQLYPPIYISVKQSNVISRTCVIENLLCGCCCRWRSLIIYLTNFTKPVSVKICTLFTEHWYTKWSTEFAITKNSRKLFAYVSNMR